MACPVCGCQQFYVKDPDDEFEVHEFECRQGQPCFQCPEDAPEMKNDTETYCEKCAWHGRFDKVKEDD